MPSERAIMAEIFGREQIAPDKRAALEDVVREVATSAGIVLESDIVVSTETSSPDAEEVRIRADMARRSAALVEAQRQHVALTAEIARLKAVAEQTTRLATPPAPSGEAGPPVPPPRPEKRPPTPTPPRSAKPTPPKGATTTPRGAETKTPPPVASSDGEFHVTLADFGLPQAAASATPAPEASPAPPSAPAVVEVEGPSITELESQFDEEQSEVGSFGKLATELKAELEKFPDEVKTEILSVLAEAARVENEIVGPGEEPDHNQVAQYRTWLKAGIDANRALQDLYEKTAGRLKDFFDQLIEKTKDIAGRSNIESHETEIDALFARALADKKITTKGKKKAWYNKKGIESNHNVIHGIWKRSSELSAENYYDRYEAEKRLAALHSEYLTALTAYATELKALYPEEPVS